MYRLTVQGVLPVVLLNRGTEFFLRQPVVLVRHADVPQDILVPGFRHQRAAGQLRIVVVRPYRDDFKLLRLAVIVHLEVMVIVGTQPGKLAALLKGYMFHQSPNLIVVGVESQVIVLEVVNRKGLAVLVLDLFRAHAGHDTDTPGIDVRKGLLLIVVDDTVPFTFTSTYFTPSGSISRLCPYFAASMLRELPMGNRRV